MSVADLRKRLAKLEARKRRGRLPPEEMSEAAMARRIAFTLWQAVEGIGGPEIFECGRQIAVMLCGTSGSASPLKPAPAHVSATSARD